MSTNLEDLDPDSPEYDAALEAAQAEEDAANGNEEVTDEDQTAGDEPKAEVTEETTTESAPTTDEPKTEPEKQNKPSGVFSKDGKTVLPFAVVQAARQDRAAERQARMAAEAERDALRQQIEDLKAGKTPVDEDADPLDKLVAEAAEDVPVVAELHKRLKEAERALKQASKPREEEPEADPRVAALQALQDDIDSVPLLAEWQAADAEKFDRAKAIDAALVGSPKWRGKPQAERFAFVAKQVAAEYDIDVEVEDPAPPTKKQTPNKADPKTVVAGARRAAPNTLSDFKGGAADPNEGRIDKMPAAKAVARMSEMTDEEIDEHLAKFG
jgi:hypothetical protein